jgi:hypothetical protein
MSNTELLIREIETLPADCINEVLDFVGSLKQKRSDNCPDHIPNAVTLAAMQEADAILRGEIPGAITIDPAQYQNREELKTALKVAFQN